MSRQLKLNQHKAKAGKCVLYVMSRDQRIQDNHALQIAQQAALDNEVALVVMFNLSNIGVRSREHYEFMIKGLKDIESRLRKKKINFVLKIGNAYENISEVVENLEAIEVIFDFSPMPGPRRIQKNIANKLNIPVSVVDTHNIIPCWLLSEKEEYAAHTIRSKVHKNLEQWVEEPEEVVEHKFKLDSQINNDWKEVEKFINTINSCGIKIQYDAGEVSSRKNLEAFIKNRLSNYAEDRNVPTIDGQSNLSAYLHFGQISSLRVTLEILKTIDEPPLLFKVAKLASYEGSPKYIDSVNAYLEELIVRKELSDNYVFYNRNFANIDGAKDWAKSTLKNHESDPREFVYSIDQLEKAGTHDAIWNAAQNELLKTGKIHGYMRMYWAKKILEWSDSPQQAIENCIYLNDHYSIDGGDPNGYVGIMWSIAGIHDRPWFEREVFGKIRYMNESGLKRRFDVEEYKRLWN